jgi:hypothetical protein
VSLDPADDGWVPALPIIGKPTITFEANRPGAITVTLDTMLGSRSIPLTIDSAGQLTGDASSLGPDLAGVFDRWIANLNAQLSDNKRKFDVPKLEDGVLQIRKTPIAAAVPPVTAPPPGPLVTPGGGGGTGTPDGSPTKKGLSTPKKVAAVTGFVAALGLGGCWLFASGDNTVETPPATEENASESEVGVGPDVDAEDQSALDAAEADAAAADAAAAAALAAEEQAAADHQFAMLQLLEQGKLIDLNEENTYNSSNYGITGAAVPDELKQAQARFLTVNGKTIVWLSGAGGMINDVAVEFDTYVARVQRKPGVDLTGANAAPLGYFENTVGIRDAAPRAPSR